MIKIAKIVKKVTPTYRLTDKPKREKPQYSDHCYITTVKPRYTELAVQEQKFGI